MAALPASRTLVFLRRAGQSSRLQKAEFTQCILDYFGCEREVLHVSCNLKDNKLILSDDGEDKIIIKHPAFCPLHCLEEKDLCNIPEDTQQRGIDIGVATLLCTSDRKLLLTRRAEHLRTFPGIWVPPGGHVESGETLVQAGLRELAEETGLKLDDKECQTETIALWESAYPAMLSAGMPRRHHVVVYQTVYLSHDHQTLQSRLKLQVSEVGAAAWFDEGLIRAIAAHARSVDAVKIPSGIPESFRATVIDPHTNKPSEQHLSTEVLFNTMPSLGKDVERVSTGTVFALQQWCKMNPTI